MKHQQPRRPFLSTASAAAIFIGGLAMGCAEPVLMPTPVVVDVDRTEEDILSRLNSIDDVTAYEIPTSLPDYRAFTVTIEQPQEHDVDDTVTFSQRMLLLHRADDAPMIAATTGYDLFGGPEVWADYRGEVTRLTNGNQLMIEHRFFGESIPDVNVRDWESLTVKNAASDSHKMRALLGEIYTGAWIGTGVSKGGMTAIFHHAFFPDDLDGIVPYVAPISFGMEDPRYVDFLRNIGPEDGECAENVRGIALAILERLDEIAPVAAASSPGGAGLKEDVVLASAGQNAFGLEWSFWQSWGSQEACDALPPADGTAEELAPFAIFSATNSLGLYENTLAPYGYQVAYELGSQAFDYGELSPYVNSIPWDALLPGPPLPWDAYPFFNGQTMIDVDAFLRTDADDVLAIYGEWDPWTAGMITVNANNNNQVLVAPGVGHAARIAMLDDADKEAALSMLSEMAGVELDEATLNDESVIFSGPSSLAGLAALVADPLTRRTLQVEEALQRVEREMKLRRR